MKGSDVYNIQTLNNISPMGLKQFPQGNYRVASSIELPDAILLRSYNMLEMDIPPSVMAIARAGVGVNNIPVNLCSQMGIVVFNTPGGNASSVKDLVIASLFFSSRKIIEGLAWAKTLKGKGSEVPALIEKGKSRFAGPEITGKKLGVIGLGAVGVMVANDAAALGMEVTGYDPFISVESAWGLSRGVRRASGFEKLLATADYITLHVPLSKETEGMINGDKFKRMKKGVRILNFARDGLVNREDLKTAIRNETVSVYVTDFPDEELLELDNVIAIPHLGASTPEAEDKCAVMAVQQVREYLETGNIRNSVNFPTCEMDMIGIRRIVVANKNIPRMVGQITAVIAGEGINIADMLNKSREDIAYTIIDIDNDISEESEQKIRQIEGVLKARVI
jgi:D-3-phosphoglycerate dehydrogenase